MPQNKTTHAAQLLGFPMIHSRFSLYSIVLTAALGCAPDAVTGADGTTGADGADGADALNALLDTADEPAGENCEDGGTAISYGIDSNANDVLDADEVTDTEYICDEVDDTVGLSSETAYVGGGTAACLGGYVSTSFGYDLDGNGMLEGDEVESSVITCNPSPQIDVDSVLVVEDCGVDTEFMVGLSDAGGSVDDATVSVLNSGSEFSPTLSIDGVLTIPAGDHVAGAVLALTATDNYGAETQQMTAVAFTGTDCLPTDRFYGVQPDTCESVEVDPIAGDDRGGLVVTSDYAFYNGDRALIRLDPDLTNVMSVSEYDTDTLMGDAVSGTLYSLWSSEFVITNLQDASDDQLEDNGPGISWNQLAVIDEDTFEVLSTVDLESEVYVPDYDNEFEYDFGDEGVEANVRVVDTMLAMRDGHMLIATKMEGNSSNNRAIVMRLVDVVTGLNLSSTTVVDLYETELDDEAFSELTWDEQEVDIQHYLLLERDGEHFVTYRNNDSEEWIEVNVATGEILTASESFGMYADLKNLAMDASGLWVYFHTEDGFLVYHEESVERCMVLFGPNDGSIDDRGGDYDD
jgi:hypothetical protein